VKSRRCDRKETSGEFGRIEFIDRIGKELKRINVKDPAVRKRAKTLEGAAQLKQPLEDA
jgi:hypothetical protein